MYLLVMVWHFLLLSILSLCIWLSFSSSIFSWLCLASAKCNKTLFHLYLLACILLHHCNHLCNCLDSGDCKGEGVHVTVYTQRYTALSASHFTPISHDLPKAPTTRLSRDSNPLPSTHDFELAVGIRNILTNGQCVNFFQWLPMD